MVTLTSVAGALVTVTNADPTTPSIVAEMSTDPGATPDTTPVPLTDATALLALAPVVVRPVNALPLASRGVAANVVVAPTNTVTLCGTTTTVATGTGITVIVAVPLCPSLVAVMVAVPEANPSIRPLPETRATVGALLVHVTTRPLSGLPPPSRGVAVSCVWAPICTVAVGGATCTVATGMF